MARKIILLTILVIGLFGLVKVSLAADQTAASCSAADIQTAINTVSASSDGGTVNIPACSGGSNGSNWTGATDKVCIYTTKELRILGAGKTQTVIEYKNSGGPGYGSCGGHSNYGGTMMEFHGSGFKEFGNITLRGNVELGGTKLLYIHASEGMTNVRVHDFALNNIVQPGIYLCQNPNDVMVIDHGSIGNAGPWGILTTDMDATQTTIPVTDASYFPMVSTSAKYIRLENEQIYCTGKSGNTLTGCTRGSSPTSHSAGKMAFYFPTYGIAVTGGPYELDWVEPPQFGINNGLFIEDTDFNGTYHPVAGFYATRITARHNTFKNVTSGFEGHEAGYTSGCQYGTPSPLVGTYRYEIYDNTWDGSEGTCAYATYSRSGHWIVTDNTIKNCHHGHTIMNDNNPMGVNCTAANDCPWTSKDGLTTQSCYQSPYGIHIWNNIYQNNTYDSIYKEQNTQCIRQDKEYFLRAPQVGDPLISNYTKFTYPHPLTLGDSSDTTPPSAPTGLTVE